MQKSGIHTAAVDRTTDVVIWDISLSRVVLSGLVGAALATAGVIFQGILLNPLADPFTIGVSAGAAFGVAVLVMPTRAAVALERNLPRLAGGIVAIGNAPTALLRLLELLADGAPRPALVVGVPVGFVNAAESKDALARQDCPYITALGPKGGSAVAASIINALAIMALEETPS